MYSSAALRALDLTLSSGARRSRRPASRAGPITTLKLRLMLRDRIVIPVQAFDAGLRPGPFPGAAASLPSGLLAVNRTFAGRRRRAYEHEDPPWHYVAVSPGAHGIGSMYTLRYRRGPVPRDSTVI